MTIHKILVNYKGTAYVFEIDRDADGELYLVSPITGELIIVKGQPLREKFQVVALKHLTQMNM